MDSPLQNTSQKQSQTQSSEKLYVRKQPCRKGSYANLVNTGKGKLTTMDPQQQKRQLQAPPGFSRERPTFWTACPFCKLRYQYYRDIVNKTLFCQTCMKPFIAYDVDDQGLPYEANNNQLLSPKNESTSQDGCKMFPETIVKNFPSSMGLQGSLDNTDSKTKGKEYANDKAEEHKNNEKGAAAENDNSKEEPEAANESESNFGSKTKPGPEIIEVPDTDIIEVPDPEFYNFDSDKRVECFAVGQIWAIFDDLDCMPRFYALIKKVYFTPGFKVRITWLEPYPDDPDEIAWKHERLPVACGKFKYDNTENKEEIGIFSHRVDIEKITTRGSLWIYPAKGETWALFKNWDIKWSSDPDNHRNYEYDFVEVLSDYTKESGINVAHLVKIKGFVSLFKPTKNNGMVSFQIPPNELFRFSHRVPSFRTTGREREDVPEGYFELDPFSLPGKLLETSNPVDVSVNTKSNDAKTTKTTKTNDSPKSLADKNPHMTKKRSNPEEKNTLDRGNSKRGNWSPRLANACNKSLSEESAGHLLDNASSGSDAVKSHDDSTFGRKSGLRCQTDFKEMGSDGVNVNSESVVEQCRPSASHLDRCEFQEAEFYSFKDDKSREKFKTGQIWAMYCELDGFPKYYAQIEKVELSPNFKLHIKWLEPCAPPKGVIQWLDKKMPISCGTFTSGGNEEFADTTSFSHLSTGVSAGKENKYEIYPKKGEVWALYRNFNCDWTCSDLQKCEYDMVEVLEVYHARWVIVMVLRQVASFRTVLKAERKAGHDFIMGIPWIELFRFSHQVPAFRLTEPRYGSLRGCWEVDPKSMAACLVPFN